MSTEPLHGPLPPDPPPPDASGLTGAMGDAWAILAPLTPAGREVALLALLALHTEHGGHPVRLLTTADVARYVGIPVPTLQARLARGWPQAPRPVATIGPRAAHGWTPGQWAAAPAYTPSPGGRPRRGEVVTP